MKFSTVLILLMGMLQFIPPRLSGTEDFHDSYYTILFALLTVLAIGLPFIDQKMPRVMRLTSSLFAGWFFSAFVFHVMGLFHPEIMDNIDTPGATFTFYTLAFCGGLTFIMIREIWMRQPNR